MKLPIFLQTPFPYPVSLSSHPNPRTQVVGAAPPCGDGACEPPFEFPAFGRFGCKADCGTFTNVTSIAYDIDTNFPSESARAASSWNLCMMSPISLCW